MEWKGYFQVAIRENRPCNLNNKGPKHTMIVGESIPGTGTACSKVLSHARRGCRKMKSRDTAGERLKYQTLPHTSHHPSSYD